MDIDTCTKDTKNHKIAEIRALAERCGVATVGADGKNKTRAVLCRDIVAAQGGDTEVPSPDLGSVGSASASDMISDDDCRKNTKRYKIAQIRDLAISLGIPLTDPSGKKLTRAELCDAIRDSQGGQRDIAVVVEEEEVTSDDDEPGEVGIVVDEETDDEDETPALVPGANSAPEGCEGMREKDCMNTRLNTKEAVYEMAEKCGINIYKPGTKTKRPKAQLCAEIARFSVASGDGFSERDLRRRLETAESRADWQTLLTDLGFEYGQPAQGTPQLQKRAYHTLPQY